MSHKETRVAKKTKTKEVKDFNKSAFVRANPDKKPAEIVEAASALGHEITPALVYAIRSADKQKNGSPASKVAKTPGVQLSAGGLEAGIREMVRSEVREALRDIFKAL